MLIVSALLKAHPTRIAKKLAMAVGLVPRPHPQIKRAKGFGGGVWERPSTRKETVDAAIAFSKRVRAHGTEARAAKSVN